MPAPIKDIPVHFFPSAWKSGVALLSDFQELLYFKICCHNWDTGKLVPGDQVARLFRDGPPADLKESLDVLVTHGKLYRDGNGSVGNKKALDAYARNHAPPKEPEVQRQKRAPVPKNWWPDDKDILFANKEGLTSANIEREVGKFIDWSENAEGSKGCFRNFSGAWRNWCRRFGEREPGDRGLGRNGVARGDNGVVATVARVAAEMEHRLQQDNVVLRDRPAGRPGNGEDHPASPDEAGAVENPGASVRGNVDADQAPRRRGNGSGRGDEDMARKDEALPARFDDLFADILGRDEPVVPGLGGDQKPH